MSIPSSLPSTPNAGSIDDKRQLTDPISEEKLRQRLNATAPPSISTSGDAPPAIIGCTIRPNQPSFQPILPPILSAHPTPSAQIPRLTQPSSHPLIHHPNPEIRQLAENIDEMNRELTSTGINATKWPRNVSLWNFGDYLLCPTLVYELEYPRTEKYAVPLSHEIVAGTMEQSGCEVYKRLTKTSPVTEYGRCMYSRKRVPLSEHSPSSMS